MQTRESVMKKIILISLGLMLFACDTNTKKAVLDKKINKVEQIDYSSLVSEEDCTSAGGTWTEGVEAVRGYGPEGEEWSVAAVDASCSDPLSDSLK